MAAVSVRSNDGNPASAGGGRMVRFAGFTAEAPAVGSAAEEGAAGTVAEAAAGVAAGCGARAAHTSWCSLDSTCSVRAGQRSAPAAARGHVATPT